MLANAHCVVYYFQHAHGWHTHQNENRFLAFGSLLSNAEVENAIISSCIIVCSNLSGIKLLCFFLFGIYMYNI